MKKVLKNIVIFALLCSLLTVGVFASGPIEINGEFAGTDVPEGWEVYAYNGEDVSVSLDHGEVTLTSRVPNDLRLCRTVSVEENTVYVLRAEMSASNVLGGRGATIGIDNYAIDGCYIYSRNMLGSADFTPVELIFSTDEGQTEILLALRLGGYSELSSGTVRFRSVSLETADDAAGAVSLTGSETHADEPEEELTEADKIRLRSYLHLFVVIAVTAGTILLFGVYRNRERIGCMNIDDDTECKVFSLLVLIAVVLRSILASVFHGHGTDMSCWMGWGNYIAQNGTATFYTAPGHEWYDYPPGYMLVLGLIARVLRLFSVEAGSDAAVFAYMIPAVLADIATAYILRKKARENGFSVGWRLLIGCLVLFNPAMVMLSGVWGQIDSLLTVLLLLSFSLFTDGKPVRAGAVYALAIMVKWQALIYGPVLACAYILHIRSRDDVKNTVLAVLAAIGVIFAVSLPFKGEQGLLWFVGKFFNSAGGYRYASVEAYNFLALIGGNWTDVDAAAILGISYGTIGTVGILAAVAASLWLQWRDIQPMLALEPNTDDGRALYLSAALCMYTIFTFGQYMHERYVFPVIALLMTVFILTRERKWLFSALVLSVILFLNEMTAMYVVSATAMSVVRGTREHNAVVRLCSAAETFAFAGFATAVAPKPGAQKGGESLA